jgi:hypothetical protein
MPRSSSRQVEDISSVISILPVTLREKKPGLIPGEYIIPGVKDPNKECSVLLVSRARFPVYIDENRPALVVPEPSDRVAAAICRDFVVSIDGYSVGVAEPGLFWASGVYEKETAQDILVEEFGIARKLQLEWFKALISIADDNWSQYQTRKMISGLQRLVCSILGLEREWNLDIEVDKANTMTCKFCRAMIHPDSVMCMHCRGILNMEKFKMEYKTA